MDGSDDDAARPPPTDTCRATSWIAVLALAAGMAIYAGAAAQAIAGHSPGAYTALVTVVPIGLLVNNWSVLLAAARTILPTRNAVLSYLLAVCGAIAFQASVAHRRSKHLVAALALANLSALAYSAWTKRRLQPSELHARCRAQSELAAALRRAQVARRGELQPA